MNIETGYPSSTHPQSAAGVRGSLPSLCWSAIIGGTVASIGIHILLTALGVGAGLAVFTPMTDINPVVKFSMGAAIIWSFCALVSLWFGGFVAGRFSHSLHSGFVHGVLVWSLSMVLTLLLLSMGTGMVLGGALKVLGEGLGIGGKAVAAGSVAFAKEAVLREGEQLSSFVDEAVQSIPATTPNSVTRSKREIGFAVSKLFANGSDINSQDNRTAAINALVANAQMSEADATKAVDEWTTSYRKLQSELDRMKVAAEQHAREIADKAASNLSGAAIWSFFVLLAGLLVSSLGGSLGASRAMLDSGVKTTILAR